MTEIVKRGIDVETHDAQRIISALKKLSGVMNVEGPFPYREDVSYSQIQLETIWTECQLEDWLYNGNYDYIGVYSY